MITLMQNFLKICLVLLLALPGSAKTINVQHTAVGPVNLAPGANKDQILFQMTEFSEIIDGVVKFRIRPGNKRIKVRPKTIKIRIIDGVAQNTQLVAFSIKKFPKKDKVLTAQLKMDVRSDLLNVKNIDAGTFTINVIGK